MLTRMNDRRRLADDAERARNASAEKKAASTPPPAVEGPSNTAESAVPPASLPPATQEVPTVPVPAAAAAPVGPPPRDIGGDFGDELRKLLGGVTRQLPVRVDRVERLHG